MAVTQGCVEYEFHRGPATQDEDLICIPDDISFVNRNEADRQAGRAMEVLSIGSSPSALNSFRYVITGAPGSDTDDLQGAVYVSQASLASGQTPHATVPTQVAQTIPWAGSEYQLGRSLLAVDVRECYWDGAQWRACGQELLVSAPDSFVHSGPGVVNVFEQDPATNQVIRRAGRIYTDPVMPTGAEFGWAMAAPEHVPDPTQPWLAAPDYPAWVAISAPGQAKVVIFYDLDPTAPDPFCLQSVDPACTAKTMELNPGALGASYQFGYAMAAGDFDGDGIDDLAVSMPDFGGATGGEVWIWWGLSGWTTPFDLAQKFDFGIPGEFLAAEGYSQHDDWFGFSLDSGRFGPGDGEALVIGAPHFGPGVNRGAVCAFYFNIDNTFGKQCFRSPLSGRGNFDEFGYAVQVGNFNSADNFGSEVSADASLEEVAISSPGFGSTNAGRVDVFATDGSGILFNNLISENIQDHATPQTNARFGEAMASGFVQESPWEDLVIGSPLRNLGKGSSTLTKAVDLIPCEEIDGTWQATDADGITRPVKIYGNYGITPPATHISFPEGFAFDIRESGGTGAVCTVEDGGTTYALDEYSLPLDANITMWNDMWPCTGGPTSLTWADVPADDVIAAVAAMMGEPDKTIPGEVMDVTLTWDPVTNTGTMAIDLSKIHWGAFGMEPSCNLANQPVALSDREALCE